MLYKKWLEQGKKVFFILDFLKKHDLDGKVVLVTVLSFSYGDNEDEAIKSTILENAKGVEIVSRKIEQYQDELQIDNLMDKVNAPFFLGHLKI